jgi:hypothetical protein
VTSIAVLSARFFLDLHPSSSIAQEYEEELVRSHLRIIYSVSRHRGVIATGTSSEPLIAEAAAEIMHYPLDGTDTPYMNTWKLLVQFVDGGLVAQGTIGELIGRALSIFAMDDAIHASTDLRELKYQTPVTVAAYYQNLLTDEAWQTLRRSVPANRARLSEESGTKTFEEAFAGAYFHFSHYGKANDSKPMNNHYAWALWLRGTALLFQHNQELTDRAFPIFFSHLGTVSPKSISLELNQDKTGHSMNPSTVAVQSAEALDLFSGEHRLPYIAAVHCYALTTDEGIFVTTPRTHAPPTRAHTGVDQEAPRYQIDFRGLAAYRKVTEGMAADIRRLIDRSKNELFIHHPRDYGQRLLRQMLPVHDGHADSKVWFSGERRAETAGRTPPPPPPPPTQGGKAAQGSKRRSASQRNDPGPSTKKRKSNRR